VLDSQVFLELRHCGDDAHGHLTGWARQIDATQRQAVDADPLLGQLVDGRRDVEGSGLTMGMKPIVQLKIGDRITPIRMIVPAAVKHWRYARESDDISGGIMPGADLTIVAIGTQPGQMWVRIQLPGRSPPGVLKIAGEELGSNFRNI
jgi:hypothetical protein